MADIDSLAPRQITFYGSRLLYQRICEQARRERMSASCWLRRVVDDALQLVEPDAADVVTSTPNPQVRWPAKEKPGRASTRHRQKEEHNSGALPSPQAGQQ
jgi:hypothetical protein